MPGSVDRDAGTRWSRRAGHCPALPALGLFFPRLVFQLIAPGTGGTMPGCSPLSRFCPNHVAGPERWSRDAAPLGTRGDNGGRFITASLPLLLNIIPLQPFCRLLPRPAGREEPGCCLGKVASRPRASPGPTHPTGMAPGPTRTNRHLRRCIPGVPTGSSTRSLLPYPAEIRGVFLLFFGPDSPPSGGSRALTRLNLPSPDPCYQLS